MVIGLTRVKEVGNMYMSRLFAPTLRQEPAEAESRSHQLLLRAGFIRQLASGIYDFLPLALRVLHRIENIVRQEMDRAGGQELLLPALQPAELWQESGRWDLYGKELFRLQDRHQRHYCLGPTHEEVITDLVRREITSYRQLPQLLYQIQTKSRDEIRPRFGPIRGREFIMKDLYSFDRDQAGLEESYGKMHQAYCAVFDRMGLHYQVVEADTGAIGGSDSHEFVVLAQTGESEVAYCPDCGYAANLERAQARPVLLDGDQQESLPLEEVHTPGFTTVAQVTLFLQEQPDRLIKALVYQGPDGQEDPVVALVRGDRELNEVKLARHLGYHQVEMAAAESIVQMTGAPVGFTGPVGLNARIIVDREVAQMVNGICGANRAQYHLRHVNPGRDFPLGEVADIRNAAPGDSCIHCGGLLQIAAGIEVGHIFKLGTKYSEAMGARFLDAAGEDRPMVMGCYGIGVSRTLAAAVEQNHDEKGIIWPVQLAPFAVTVVPVNSKDRAQMQMAGDIYRALHTRGVETVLDDRNERAGVKFHDADLIGFPLRVTVGPRSLEKGKVDITIRAWGEVEGVLAEEAGARALELLTELARGNPGRSGYTGSKQRGS